MNILEEDRARPPEGMAGRGRFDVAVDGDTLLVKIHGRWGLRAVLRNDAALRAVELEGKTRARLDLTEAATLDTMGALSIYQLRDRLAKTGAKVEIVVADPAHRALLEQIDEAEIPPPPTRPVRDAVDRVAEVGEWAYRLARDTRELVGFFGRLVVVMVGIARHPQRLRLTATIANMHAVGLNALPIVGLLSFLIGIVLAYQSADQLRRFGAEIFVINLLGISILGELGILITAIIIAGRSGSAFTAQIGTMKVNQEVDAMRTIGLDPMELLVVPRVLALIVTLPLLAFYASIVGLLGGALMCYADLGISLGQFVQQLGTIVTVDTLFVGLVKAPVFAFVIAMVGCFQGLEVSGSAESVGQRTTQSVVESIFLVIVLDALFSIVFSALGI